MFVSIISLMQFTEMWSAYNKKKKEKPLTFAFLWYSFIFADIGEDHIIRVYMLMWNLCYLHPKTIQLNDFIFAFAF